jgi:hypothetical protein
VFEILIRIVPNRKRNRLTDKQTQERKTFAIFFLENRNFWTKKHETHEGVIDSDFIKKNWLQMTEPTQWAKSWDLSKVNPEKVSVISSQLPSSTKLPRSLANRTINRT